MGRSRQFAKLAKDIDTNGNVKQDGISTNVTFGLDSATIIGLIDSDYVTHRTTGAIIAYNRILTTGDG